MYELHSPSLPPLSVLEEWVDGVPGLHDAVWITAASTAEPAG
jgi:hypothetical protein